VARDLLGRTNLAFPEVWLSLATPLVPSSETWVQDLVLAALDAKTVIDISSNAGLWGGQMRGTDALLMSRGGLDIERAPDEKGASDLIQAHLIETLSAIGRESIDFYFLRVRRGLEEFQINGALEALSSAKAEGHIRFLGLSCEGPPLAVLGVWQFRDAFEVLLLSEEDTGDQGLVSLARERRVGVVVASGNLIHSDGRCTLFTARSARDVQQIGDEAKTSGAAR
jgi:aryl-alcohol dehydrogenase-like predicted oxidoreductase